MTRKTEAEKPKYSDSVHTKNRGLVRLTELAPNTRLLIGNRWVLAGDIPLTAAFLQCGHPIRGIALQVNDVIFCDTCHVETFVATVNS